MLKIAKWLGLLLVGTLVVACGAEDLKEPAPVDSKEASTTAEGDEYAHCKQGPNLLQHVDFTAPKGERLAWRSAQHSSKRSFEVSLDDGVLAIEQVAAEPWFMFKQRVEGKQLPGNTLLFSAETKGRITLLGAESKAGMYYGVMTRNKKRYSVSAEGLPNSGEWDWRPFNVMIELPDNPRWLEVGFTHQGGGTLYARNPVLRSLDCSE